MGALSGWDAGFVSGHSNLTQALLMLLHVASKSWSPFPSSGEPPVSAPSRCSEEGAQAQQVNLFRITFQEKNPGQHRAERFHSKHCGSEWKRPVEMNRKRWEVTGVDFVFTCLLLWIRTDTEVCKPWEIFESSFLAKKLNFSENKCCIHSV